MIDIHNKSMYINWKSCLNQNIGKEGKKSKKERKENQNVKEKKKKQSECERKEKKKLLRIWDVHKKYIYMYIISN